MLYNVCKLINFPRSGGTTPENWFASRSLKKKKQNLKEQKEVIGITQTR